VVKTLEEEIPALSGIGLIVPHLGYCSPPFLRERMGHPMMVATMQMKKPGARPGFWFCAKRVCLDG